MPTKSSDFLREVRYDQFSRNYDANSQICGHLTDDEEENISSATEEYDPALMLKISGLADGSTVISIRWRNLQPRN
jgi:hypothetical protein